MHNDDLYIDAMERLLGTLLNNFYPNTQISEIYSSEIFHTYVLYRLSIHEDTEDKTEEITEMEENDRVKFNNQLEIIGKYYYRIFVVQKHICIKLFYHTDL